MQEIFAEAGSMDYSEVAEQLFDHGLASTPSHLHGAICGVLCGGFVGEPEDSLGAVAQALDDDLHGVLAELCIRLVAATRSAFGDENLEFQLFLPDDEDVLALRLRALGEWCRGFLAGYAVAVSDPGQEGLGEEAAEILRDLAAVAEVEDTEADTGAEEDAEHDYFEVTEYLRFAVLNLYLDGQAAMAEEP
jgi:uncharacterized protein YgfB (UPF0149 family)